MYSKAIMLKNALMGFGQSVMAFCNSCIDFVKWCFGLTSAPVGGFFGNLFTGNVGVFGPVASFIQTLCTNLFGVLFIVLMTRIVMTFINFVNPNT